MIIYCGSEEIEILDNDSTYRYRKIGGENTLIVKWSSAIHQEIPVGSWTTYKGEVYTLRDPQGIKLKSGRNIEYTMTMYWAGENLSKYIVRNPIDNRIKFPYTATPREHLKLIVDNLNMRESGWTIGNCIEGAEVEIVYNGVKCNAALSTIASTFKTEFDIATKSISLCRVEHNKSNPLPLSYGKGNGFKTNTGRTNTDDNRPIEVLYIQGGEQNINASDYGSTTLLLPKSQTLEYEGRSYITDAEGLSIRRSDKDLSTYEEYTLDCSDYYPKRVGTVSGVETEVRTIEGKEVTFYDIIDSSIPDALDYGDSNIVGQTMCVKFQSGMLAGKSFDIESDDEGNLTGYVHSERRFKLCQQTYNTIAMPSDVYVPEIGDKYAVFNCDLPAAYICDDTTQSGASWDMFRYAAKFLYENEDPRFTFTGELDSIYAKQNWDTIEDKIVLGGYILFSDPRYQIEGVKIRITGIKEFVHKPYSPILELSNITVGASIKSQIEKIPETEVMVKDRYDSAVSYTQRRYRDAVETMEMLSSAMLDNFTGAINPITVQTMSMLVGDESLQFRFVNSASSATAVSHNVVYDQSTRVLTVPSGVIQHMTLGVSSLSSSHSTDEYKFWSLPEFVSAPLTVGETKYYLYAKVSKTSDEGTFVLSNAAISMNSASGHYHLLVGVLNSEYNKERSFVTLYGFTEVLPGRVTTDRVVSGDGQSYFDMLNNALKLGDALSFVNGVLRVKNAIVQSPSGAEDYMGVYRGDYDGDTTYYPGDSVTYEVSGKVSTYRYIYTTAASGKVPTSSTYWKVTASSGGDGAYYEYRYAKNGSRTTPPTLATTAKNPSGWSTTQPTLTSGYYIWKTISKKNASGDLLSSWSTPVRDTPYDGRDGDDGDPGADGAVGPSPTGGDTYDASKTYYGNSKRVDVVYYDGLYYIARADVGTFSGKTPTNTQYWNYFGAQFDSVATEVLWARCATIANFLFNDSKLKSQATTDGNPNIILDGVIGYAAFRKGLVGQLNILSDGSLSPTAGSDISIRGAKFSGYGVYFELKTTSFNMTTEYSDGITASVDISAFVLSDASGARTITLPTTTLTGSMVVYLMKGASSTQWTLYPPAGGKLYNAASAGTISSQKLKSGLNIVMQGDMNGDGNCNDWFLLESN